MTRNPNIALITIGYNHYAFEDCSQALQLMAIMANATMVDSNTYSLNSHKVTEEYFLADGDSMPALKFAAMRLFNTNETVKEAKERLDREQKDREDMNQEMREAPPALPAPAPVFSDDDQF